MHVFLLCKLDARHGLSVSSFRHLPRLPRYTGAPTSLSPGHVDLQRPLCVFSLVLTYESSSVLWTEWALLLSTSVQFWVALKRAGCVLLEKQAYPPNP